MSRLLLTLLGGLLAGIALWCIVGFAAAQIATKNGPGPDGGGAMSGFFFIGGIGGIVGAILGSAIIWRVLADPSRMSTVVGGLLGLLAVLIAGIAYVMAPMHVERNDFPQDKRGEFQVETGFPQSQFAALGKQPRLTFELRAGGFLLETPSDLRQLRQEGERTIISGAFRIQEVRTWVLAIMNGETQIASTTAGMEGIDGTLNETTPWTEWKAIESGLEVRWRFAVLPR